MTPEVACETGRGPGPLRPRDGLQSQQQLMFDAQFTEKFGQFKADVTLHALNELRGGHGVSECAVGASVVRQAVIAREGAQLAVG